MSAKGVFSATRIFRAPMCGRRGGNKSTARGATTEATVAPSRPAIHQPRKVRLVGDLELTRFVLTTPTTTSGHYSQARARRSHDKQLDLSIPHPRLDAGEVRRSRLQPVIEDLARPRECGLMAGTAQPLVSFLGLQPAPKMGAHARHPTHLPAALA